MKKIIKDTFLILTKKEKRQFINLAAMDIIVSILDIGFLVLLLFIINLYSQQQQSEKYAFFNALFKKSPLLPISLFFILFIIKNSFAFIVFRMQNHFIYTVASRLSKQKLSDYQEGSYIDYIQTDSAVYLRSISQQPLEFSNYVLRGLQQIISQCVLVTLTIIPVIIYNALLFPLLLLILVPPIILAGFVMKRKLNTIRLSIKSTSEHSGQYLKEALAGFVESNTYEKNTFFLGRYHRFQSALNNLLARHQAVQNLPSRLIEVFAVFGLFILIIINSYSTSSQGLNIIMIGAFVAAAYKIIPGIVHILNSVGQVKTYSFTLAGLAANTNEKEKNTNNNAVINSIRFNNVFFKYEHNHVLNGFSIEISKGDFVCIAGPSGNGKSTFVNLLLGFLSPESGEIILNELPTTADDRRQSWNKISYIKQQSFLIHDSILKNITFDENEIDAVKLKSVLEITGVDKLIANSADGIHTIIQEEGRNFSGGQRQRIIFARALYKDFDMIILDEPFNEMDEAAEIPLLKHLKQLSDSGKTVILITHNKEGFSFCNKKIMMG
ncbi:MAG: ABC transporter ATP-binding protein [Ferruginibacter sp.]